MHFSFIVCIELLSFSFYYHLL